MAEETIIIEEEKKGQFTFRNMGKAIAKFKWWIIGASLVGALAGYLGFNFGLNQTREKMVGSFSYDINAKPKIKIGTGDEKITNKELAHETLYMSDGSIFSYTDVISESRLLAVKEANADAFGKINVSKMSKDGGIQITKASYTVQNTGEVVEEYPAKYTIKADKKFFSSKQQARDFINALVSYQLRVAETANNNYEVEDYLSENNDSSYGLYVNNLNKQYSAIKECYTSLLSEFATSSIADKDGNTLNKINNSFVASYAYGASTIINKYEGDLYNRHLVDYASVTEDSLKQQAEAYKENIRSNLLELQYYQKAVNDLANTAVIINNSSSDLTSEILRINNIILEKSEQNAFYTKEIINLGYTVPTTITLDNVGTIAYAGDGEKGVIQSFKSGDAGWKAECDAFKLSLVETAGKLKNDRLTAGDAYGFVNNKYNNHVNFYTAGIAKLEGHISNIVGAAAGLVLGFVLSTVVVTIIYVSKKDKEEQPEEPKE